MAGNGSYIVRPCGHDLHGPTLSITLKCQSKGCHHVSDTTLNGNNDVTPEWGCNSFWRESIEFNESGSRSIRQEQEHSALTLTFGVSRTLLSLQVSVNRTLLT